ncbi:FadR/GntR family transcriptional regulator [Flavobacterium cerinum]|uniref:FadR family transcriptional regulator n=1 Tax=Flavobacterium cerinum TaxID=2502784 RepID=A0ABY5IUS5_9FLAO|nr:FadR/GntR family transcriptional regulator [Flavobacterium cerinum]UUC45216.1 FadR family transcriptional regulator [Flavobacterium cerinum]
MKLYTKIVNHIKEDIANGVYQPGEKIPAEPELMEKYGVGRSTIREAIKTLAISGILNVKQGSGTTVTGNYRELNMEQRLQRADFEEINSVRKLLEEEIIRLATVNRTEQQLIEIKQCLEKRKTAILSEKPEECANADIDFHMAIAFASGNKVLAELYYGFTVILRNFFTAREPKGISRFAMNHHLHEQLFLAIQEQNENAGIELLRQLLNANY